MTLALSAAGVAGTTRTAMKFTIGLAAIGLMAAPAIVRLRLALCAFRTPLSSRFAVSLRTV